MSDYREQLEQERRRHRMPDDSYRRLEQRRDRKRRNRMITSGVLALVIAAAGGTGVVLAFRNTGAAPRPASSPTGGTVPSPSATAVSPNPSAGLGVPGVPVSAAVQFIDPDHGWFVNPTGQILAQVGGAGPVIQYSGTEQVTGIVFVDAQHGWAVSAHGHLLQTSDGGSNWTDITNDATPPLKAVQFVTRDLGWGVTQGSGGATTSGQLVKTADGGKAWDPLSTPGTVDSACRVPGTATGWAVAGAMVYQTSDDGNTWQATTLDVPGGEAQSAEVRCNGERDAWVLVLEGVAAGTEYHGLFHTTDGVTWRLVLQNGGLGQSSGVYDSQDPYPGQMVVTGSKGLALVTWCPACGNSVTLLRTSDGGKTWDRIQVAAPDKGGEPQGTSFVDPDHGWILLTVRTDKGAAPAVAKVVGSTVTISSQQTVP